VSNFFAPVFLRRRIVCPECSCWNTPSRPKRHAATCTDVPSATLTGYFPSVGGVGSVTRDSHRCSDVPSECSRRNERTRANRRSTHSLGFLRASLPFGGGMRSFRAESSRCAPGRKQTATIWLGKAVTASIENKLLQSQMFLRERFDKLGARHQPLPL